MFKHNSVALSLFWKVLLLFLIMTLDKIGELDLYQAVGIYVLLGIWSLFILIGEGIMDRRIKVPVRETYWALVMTVVQGLMLVFTDFDGVYIPVVAGPMVSLLLLFLIEYIGKRNFMKMKVYR